MGRIAEALRRAETHRRETRQLHAPIVDAPQTTLRDTDTASTPARKTRTPIADALDRAEAPTRHSRSGPAVPADKKSRASLDSPQLVAHHGRSSAVAEQYRALRTWILSHNSTGEHRILAVTSSDRGEGKSVTTANLAIALAEVRHLAVLMLDTDLRTAGLSRLFGLEHATGLADVLAGRATLPEAVHATPIENLWILPAGSVRDEVPTAALSSRTAGRLMDELRERYHYVLADTTAVQAASDAGVVGSLCTGVLMVVRMHRTRLETVKQSVRWLQSNNLHVMGCIAVAANAGSAGLLNEIDAG
ncbi:MAG: CpsD/CapB family tyrosine-protein kinase [Phycisphaerae bacterium]|nr:CpsD/CapB family tyrosine-protein kinase [Phycisphaerae bacterium]